jgi:integrase
MFTRYSWQIDPSKVLSRRELHRVFAGLHQRAPRSKNARLTLAIMRLACCFGLRASEIGMLQLRDVCIGIDRPHIRVRKEVGKGRRARFIPAWWDAGTLCDITAWKQERQQQGADENDLFVCSIMSHCFGQQFTRHALRLRFQRACLVLGKVRARQLTIHCGRHSFISHALAGGRTLAEVRSASGHTCISTTSAYVHIAQDDDGQVGNLFAFDCDAPSNPGRATPGICKKSGRSTRT